MFSQFRQGRGLLLIGECCRSNAGDILGSGERQKEAKGRAVIKFAFDMQKSCVGLNNVFHNRKPESRAAEFPRSGFVNPIESLRQAWKF